VNDDENIFITISQAAEWLRIPGSTKAGRVQKLRRLARAGAIPAASKAGFAFGGRYYTLRHLRRVEAALRRAEVAP